MAAQDFISIGSLAAGQDTQLSTAHVQQARQNSRYLKEWRAPVSTLAWPYDHASPASPPLPQIAFARWSGVMLQRYWMPDNLGLEAMHVSVTIQGIVATNTVRVVALSRQGYLGGYDAVSLDALATTLAVASLNTTLEGVRVVPGWNDLVLWVESDAEWDPANVGTDWVIETSGGTPRLIDTSGSADLAVACPHISASVPHIALRVGIGSGKAEDADYGEPVTIAWVDTVAGAPDTYPFGFIAEWPTISHMPPNALGQTASGAAFEAIFWARLGVLVLVSASVSPFEYHPDKANDPMARWYQIAGQNVADVAWEASKLHNMRQPQVTSMTQPPAALTWPGMWRVGSGPDFWDVFGNFFTVREAALRWDADVPPGPTYAECTWLASWIDPAATHAMWRGAPAYSARISIVWRMEVFDPSTDTVLAYVEGTNLHRPLPHQRQFGAVLSPFWIRSVNDQVQRAAYDSVGDGQPWSHDGAIVAGDLGAVFTPGLLRLRCDNVGMVDGDLYVMRLRVKFTVPPGNLHSLGATILATSAATWRLDWGTVEV